MGRPRLAIPNNFNEIAKKYLSHEITNVTARALLTKGCIYINLVFQKHINKLKK